MRIHRNVTLHTGEFLVCVSSVVPVCSPLVNESNVLPSSSFVGCTSGLSIASVGCAANSTILLLCTQPIGQPTPTSQKCKAEELEQQGCRDILCTILCTKLPRWVTERSALWFPRTFRGKIHMYTAVTVKQGLFGTRQTAASSGGSAFLLAGYIASIHLLLLRAVKHSHRQICSPVRIGFGSSL